MSRGRHTRPFQTPAGCLIFAAAVLILLGAAVAAAGMMPR